MFYDATRLYVVIPIIAAFTLVSALFLVSGFSFGYFSHGFLLLHLMVLGYLWLNCFTDLNYDHRLAGFARSRGRHRVSSSLSLFITSPLPADLRTVGEGLWLWP